MLNPKSVALIGATEAPGSAGRTLMENLRSFGGALFPVNPKITSVLGVKTFSGIADIKSPVDLAIIATPAITVPDVVSECAAAGVKGAVIISAGFRECGPSGLALEEAILSRRGNMRLIGPNCLGVMVPGLGLNATLARTMALPGKIALISQSGALCTSILDWSLREKVGFSNFLSVGSMLDLGWGDLLFHVAGDLDTRSILIYMESIGDARSFLSAAREISLRKPIIVIKAGKSEAAARAVAAHTGTDSCSDEVFDAALRRVGVLRVNTISDLFSMAEVLNKQPRPKGPRLVIVTNAGGPGVLATDMVIAQGGEIAQLSDISLHKLNEVLPAHWSRNNPVDILGDATAERFTKAVEIVSADRDNDGVLVVLTPQAMTDATEVAKGLLKFKKLPGKPILASWMGNEAVADGEAILNAAGIPTFQYPDMAARAFCYMWRYTRNLQALYETPALSARVNGKPVNHARANGIIQKTRKAKRTLLTKIESRRILEAYEIPLGKPTQASGSCELTLKSRIDPQFGPVLSFGARGLFGGASQDQALGLPPLTATLARRMMERTRVYEALKGPGKSAFVNLTELENVLVNFSLLVAEQRWIKEIEIDPLFVSPTQIFAHGARIVLHPAELREEKLPRLAIRPYPGQYVSHWNLGDGRPLTFRPIRPEDEPLMVTFHKGLSEQSVYFRYFGAINLELRVTHERLTHICFNDYDREIAIVVSGQAPETGKEEILGVGRLMKVLGADTAEFAIVITDHLQGQGLGSHLLKLMVDIGRQEGLRGIFGHILAENYGMQRVAKKAGFTVDFDYSAGDMKAVLTFPLNPSVQAMSQ